MKVLQVLNQYLNFGGEENSANRMALHLEEGGVDIVRFIRSAKEWQIEGGPSRLEQAGLIFNNESVLDDLREVHKREQPDVWLVHNILPVVSLGVYRLAKELDVPVLQWLHNYRPLSLSGSLRLKGRQLTTTSKWIHFQEVLDGSWRGRASSAVLAYSYWRARRRGWFDSVSAWVAVSGVMEESFRRANFYPEKLHHLHHSWEISPSQSMQSELGDFLYLGRLLTEKGVLFLLELFSDERLRHCRLRIAGDGELRSAVENCGSSNIEYIGWVQGEAKKREIAKSSAVLFPSLWEEPLSTIAYEAYEQEVPVLCSDRGGMVEIVSDGLTGRILPAGDIDSWVEAISRAAEKPIEMQELGMNGRLWLEKSVSPEAWRLSFLEIAEAAVHSRTEDREDCS